MATSKSATEFKLECKKVREQVDQIIAFTLACNTLHAYWEEKYQQVKKAGKPLKKLNKDSSEYRQRTMGKKKMDYDPEAWLATEGSDKIRPLYAVIQDRARKKGISAQEELWLCFQENHPCDEKIEKKVKVIFDEMFRNSGFMEKFIQAQQDYENRHPRKESEKKSEESLSERAKRKQRKKDDLLNPTSMLKVNEENLKKLLKVRKDLVQIEQKYDSKHIPPSKKRDFSKEMEKIWKSTCKTLTHAANAWMAGLQTGLGGALAVGIAWVGASAVTHGIGATAALKAANISITGILLGPVGWSMVGAFFCLGAAAYILQTVFEEKKVKIKHQTEFEDAKSQYEQIKKGLRDTEYKPFVQSLPSVEEIAEGPAPSPSPQSSRG